VRWLAATGHRGTTPAGVFRLDLNGVDWAILISYFVVVLGIGFAAKRYVKTGLDYFLSGRSLPAWITGLAFIAANLGALEVIGQAANGAQYGVASVHFYWIGAVPAMVFLGIVMMPFYYGARVRSVPEYLRLRFGRPTHFFNAATFAIATILIAGVNLFALALVINLMLGWEIKVSVVIAAGIVLVYITLGGLSSAIYNEVLQFFVIMAALIPLTIVGLHHVGGVDGLIDKVEAFKPLGEKGLHSWEGTGIGNVTNPLGANWLAIVFGLGFVLSFGYWTTNFAEVQRALSAKNLSAARRTPLIAAFPKLFLPFVIIIPGLIAVVTVPKLGAPSGDLSYNNSIPILMHNLLPNGLLGLAVTALLAAFMAGVAANVTAFNTVVSYDLWQAYVRKDKPDEYYVRFGRIATVVGVLIAILTAFIAEGYSNIMNYIQALFSIFNAPLFATFIIGMFWKRMTPWAGLFGLIAGTLAALIPKVLYDNGVIHYPTALDASFYQAIYAFVADAVVSVVVTLFTTPKPDDEMRGLVWGLTSTTADQGVVLESDKVWYRNPFLLGGVALGITIVLSILI
jgi:SSS family solute:Na+ symporter